MKTDLIKGFRDYDGKEAEKKAIIKEIIRQTFERYGFAAAETPVIESEKFVRGENANDEAISDIYVLQDKAKRKLALRYEFTFQLKRLMKNKKLPFKRYQVGEVFRNEPVTGNRLRQFTQCDADIIGSTTKDEAEVLAMTKEILDSLKINCVIYFNSRKLLNEVLDKFEIKKKLEVIKEIDKLDKLSEKEILINLKKLGAEKLLDIFKKPENYFKKYKSYSEIKELRECCKNYGIEIKFFPSLARGLSYYNENVFEIKAKGIKETLVGGGSYKFNDVQCTGISFGLERLCAVANLIVDLEKYLIVSLGQDKQAIKLAQKLRKKNKIVSVYYGKPSKAMEYANSYGFKRIIFVGSREVRERKFKVKIMKTGRESLLKL